MPRGGRKDTRETWTNDSVRFRDKSSKDHVPAPPPKHCEVFIRNNTVYKKCANGVEVPLGGFGASASPGFSWGKPGSGDDSAIVAGEYLWNDSVPSCYTGRIISFSTPVLRKIFITTSRSASCTIAITSHEGKLTNEVVEATVSLGASENVTQDVAIPLTSGKQLAIKVQSGECDNPVVGLMLDGVL